MLVAAATFIATHQIALVRMVSGLVFAVCFLLWIFPSLLEKLRRKHPPLASVARKFVGQQVYLEITNSGESASFWAVIEIEPGGALGTPPPPTMFARWDHTEAAKAQLVCGETGLLRVARLRGSRLYGRWHVPYSLGDCSHEVPFKDDFIDDGGAAGGSKTEIVTINVALWSDQGGVKMPLRTSVSLRGGDINGGGAPPSLVVQQLPRPIRRDP